MGVKRPQLNRTERLSIVLFILTLLTLIGSGHGLAVLPRSAVTPNLAAVPLTTPRLVHRTELLHGHLSDPAAEAVATALSDHE